MSILVRRAIAVGGQLVRVVFSSEPRHRSSAGLDDARNAANYTVTILSGTGQPLRCVGVQADVVPFPAFGVTTSGEVGVDVQLDRQMVVGMSYRVTVSSSLKSAAGELISTTFAADFAGAARPKRSGQLRRNIGLVDLASSPFAGGILVDSAGDWAHHEGIDGTHKRVWRIALTGKGAFAWMPNFGISHRLKTPATLSMLANLRTDLREQIIRQPDVVDSSTRVMMDQRGLLEITITVKTSGGEQLSTSAHATQDGDFVP